jgi:demethylmenaquinone methyltransferase / 2-methoxy-6-polyprenyl-1,4-benzoquinol methylase
MPFELPTAEEKADYVEKQFDRIAQGYDRANDAISFGMHRFWKEHAIKALNPKPGGRYLDVCCGTGDLALRIAEKAGPQSEVVGLDFSTNMLDVARHRIRHQNPDQIAQLAKVEWVRGDALHLPFADRSFDGAIISFGLRNLTNLPAGIAEMARVVKHGGRVVNLDLGHPSGLVFAPLFYFFFRHIVPIMGQLLQNDRTAYTYLPSSLETYPKPDGITEIFKAAKLQDITYEPLAFGSVAMHKGTVD